MVHSLRKLRHVFPLIILVGTSLGATECYRPVNRSGLPPRIRTIAVPAFQLGSEALRYRVETRFTEAVLNEIIRRGRGVRVQGGREGADAVIEGEIKRFYISGVLLDERARARIYEVTIVVAVTVRDQTQNRVIYDNQNYEFRGEYEFTNDPRTFFNEEDPAVERLARQFAESLVSTLVNGFSAGQIR